MKKHICYTLCLCIVMLSFASCGKRSDKGGNTGDAVLPQTTSQGKTDRTETPSVTELAPQINSSTVVDDENMQTDYPVDRESLVIYGEGNASAPSGYSPLPPVSFAASENTKGLSTTKKSHSHGPASDGKPHHTVVAFQKEFEKYSAVTLDTKSHEKTLYLTFDCGYEHDNLTADVLDTLKEKNVPAAFFCTLDHIEKEQQLISRMIKEGHIVGNHSTTHPSFAEIDRTEMAEEIEETENYLRENFGYSSRFFRFPKGEYNDSALDLVASLGYVSVFWSVAYNDWNTDNIQGKDYAVETVMSRLHDGAVILLHSVSKDNAEALPEIIDKARAQGYVFKSLTELK